MRRATHNIDANQPEIVTALLGIGATVQSLAAVGVGCPDLLVGFRGQNFLLEVKNEETSRGQKPETIQAQKKWHGFWKGRVVTIKTAEEAIQEVTR